MCGIVLFSRCFLLFSSCLLGGDGPVGGCAGDFAPERAVLIPPLTAPVLAHCTRQKAGGKKKTGHV